MFGKLKWLYNVVWGFIYLAIGYILYFNPPAMMREADMDGMRQILVVLVILMGLFRLYRGYRDFVASRES